MDARMPLAEGSAIELGGRVYSIDKLIGFGAVSFVYSARYADSYRDHKNHGVLIKEFFPYHPKGLILRNPAGDIVYPPEAESYFTLRKKSFIRGNDAHIDLQNIRADMTGANMDSFLEHGSIYTIMGDLQGESLQNVLKRRNCDIPLQVALRWIQSLLDALEVFHTNKLLHLDISPDNILMLPLGSGKSEQYRRILLIDYNSVWEMDALVDNAYFSVKEQYSAPEVRLRDQRSVSCASDLFSVCAVLLEILQSKPLDYSVLYMGGAILKQDFLINETPLVRKRISEILTKGLKLPPKRRFQSVGELRGELQELETLVSGEDVFKKSVRFVKRHTALAMLLTLFCAVALSFAAIRISENARAYPATLQEKYVTDNVMTALAASLDKLGAQIRNDLDAAAAYEAGYTRFAEKMAQNAPENEALMLSTAYDDNALASLGASTSPMPQKYLLDLLNAPNDYRKLSDSMLNSLQSILDEGKYPEKDKKEMLSLYTQYIEAYSNACYIKMQAVIQPLNEDGRKELLAALPYIPVFREKFLSEPFGSSKTELESALLTAQNAMKDLHVRLSAYGIEVTA